MRSYAREVAFCKIFQNLFEATNSEIAQFDESKLTEQDKDYINVLFNYAVFNTEDISAKIASVSKDFKLNRIYRIDLALLILAISEMEKVETPVAIVINEVVELAKKYSTAKSVSFVNGVLSGYVKEYHNG